MKTRLASWIVLALLCWGAWAFVKSWKNPWSAGGVLGSPVLSVLPTMPDGCAKGGCTK